MSAICFDLNKRKQVCMQFSISLRLVSSQPHVIWCK